MKGTVSLRRIVTQTLAASVMRRYVLDHAALYSSKSISYHSFRMFANILPSESDLKASVRCFELVSLSRPKIQRLLARVCED